MAALLRCNVNKQVLRWEVHAAPGAQGPPALAEQWVRDAQHHAATWGRQQVATLLLLGQVTYARLYNACGLMRIASEFVAWFGGSTCRCVSRGCGAVPEQTKGVGGHLPKQVRLLMPV
jgi:hypothetical protein